MKERSKVVKNSQEHSMLLREDSQESVLELMTAALSAKGPVNPPPETPVKTVWDKEKWT